MANNINERRTGERRSEAIEKLRKQLKKSFLIGLGLGLVLGTVGVFIGTIIYSTGK